MSYFPKTGKLMDFTQTYYLIVISSDFIARFIYFASVAISADFCCAL